MSLDGPDWLKSDTAPKDDEPATSGGITSVPPPPPPPAAPVASSSTTADGEDDPDLPGVILTMRLANMGVAIALIAVSILVIIQIKGISKIVLAVYATCGGLLICCLETQLKFIRVVIAMNFGFLFNSVWRFIFYLILASVAWSFQFLPASAVAIAFIAIAFFNTYVLCRYPGYRKMREKIAEEEDKRIEARISKEVRKQAANQILGGNNPNNRV